MDEPRSLVYGGDGEGVGEGGWVQWDWGGVGDEFIDVGRFVVGGRHLSMDDRWMGVRPFLQLSQECAAGRFFFGTLSAHMFTRWARTPKRRDGVIHEREEMQKG